MKKRKSYLPFHLRIFWSVTACFVLLTTSFMLFQYSREKQFKIELLNTKLIDHNDVMHRAIKQEYNLDSLVKKTPYRTTVMDLSGNVLFDSEIKTVGQMDNHGDRPEIKKALKNGMGYDVRRKSKTTSDIYFYSAKRYQNHLIRSAMPYNTNLEVSLKADLHFIQIAILLLITLAIALYTVMRHLGENIKQLNEFAMKAKRDEIIEYPAQFPNNELGDISRHIVQIYNRLMNVKIDLEKEKQLVISQKEEKDVIKRQLTQNIAHELKTPVSSIQGYLETIIHNKDLPREILDDFIQKSYTQSTRLSALLQDISKLTRIDEAPELIQKERIDISELIKQVISDVSLQLKEKNIHVINEMEQVVLPCHGNLSLLYSLFRNLFDNTITYAGNDVAIEVKQYQYDSDMYYFSYADTGVGIEEKHLTRIFERFYRIDKGRSRKVGGTGLGLSIAKHAVLFHNGEITAQTKEGGGIVFLFSIRKE